MLLFRNLEDQMTQCLPYSENGERAFTFIELMFVIIIIGVLVSLALPGYSRTLEKIRMAEGMQILETLRNAQYAYKTEFGSYTGTLGDLDVTIPVSNNFILPTVFNDVPNFARVTRTGSSYDLYIKESGLIVCVSTGQPGICVQIGCRDIDAGAEDPCNQP